MLAFLSRYRIVLTVAGIWVLSGAFAPAMVATIVSVVAFLFLLRSRDNTAIFFSVLLILIFSDSRSLMFAFAADAKVGVILAALAYVILNYNSFNKPYAGLVRNFLPFFLYVLVLLPFADNFFNSFQKSVSYLLLFFIAPVLVSQANKENNEFLWDLVRFLLLILVIGLILRVISPGFVMLLGRYRGLLGNPNGLGIFLVLALPIFRYCQKNYKDIGKEQWTVNLFYLVFFASLFMCQSRSALMAVVIFLGFYFLPAMRGVLGLILFLVLVASYELIMQQLPFIVIGLGLEEYFRIDTLMEGSGRVVAWDFAWHHIGKNFYFGSGFDYTNELYHKNYAYLSQLGHQGNAHNSYLTLWLDTGLIGLLLYGLGMIKTVLQGLKKDLITLPAVYALLFSANFESWLTASLNPFTILFLTLFTLILTKNEREQPEKPLENETKNSSTSPVFARW